MKNTTCGRERVMKRKVALIAVIAAAIISLGGVSVHADGNDTSENRAFASRLNETALTTLKPVYAPLAEHITERFNLAGRAGVGIDIGGGPGNLAVELALRTPSMEWINVDINPAFSTYVTERAEKAGVGGRVDFVQADVHRMPFQDGYADVIVSRGSFHFWDNLETAFTELYRVLKPGGAAFIGRGFSENLPVEVARRVRERQNGGPSYDVAKTAAELKRIMAFLCVTDFRVILPEPAGSDGVNYGVWLSFRKPERGMARLASGQKRVYVLDPVEVLGAKLRDVIREPRSESVGLELAQTVVTSGEIEKQGARTIMEALEHVPGARIETRGRKVKQFFSVRGQTYPYPEYAVNGALFREFYEIPYFFSTADIERIEVLRSGAGMLTGVSGMTGIVNIVPRRYTEPETSWGIEYGSFDTWRSRLSHGAKVNGVSYSIGLDVPHTDGPDGRNAAEDMTNVHGTVAWKPMPSLSVEGSLYHIHGKRKLARAEAPAVKKLRETLERYDPFTTTFASVKTLYRPAETSSTEFLLYYANRDHNYTSETADGTTSARELDFEWGLNIVQSITLSPDNVFKVGAYYNRWVAPDGKRFYLGRECDLETVSAVAVDEHRFGKLTVDAGLKWARTYMHEYGAFNIEGSGKNFSKVEPVSDEWEPSVMNASLGARFDLTTVLSLTANLAAGQVRSRNGTLTADGDKPENELRIKGDAGFRLIGESLGEATVVGFVTRQDDAIVLTGKTSEVNERIVELYGNRDQYQAGVEINTSSVTLRDIARFYFNTVAMTTRADAGDGTKRLKEYPEYILGGGVYSHWNTLDFNLFWKYMSSYENTRFSSIPEPQPLGDFHTVSVTCGKSFGNILKSRAYFEVENLFDEEYATVVGYPDFGRRYTVGIRQVF